METPEFPSSSPRPVAAPAAGFDLQQQIDSLRALLNVVLLILLLMTVVGVFLLNRQVSKARQQVESNQAQVDKLSADYDTVLKPRINLFLQALVRYSQTDPNFVNVLRKYPILQQGAPAPASAVPAPPAK